MFSVIRKENQSALYVICLANTYYCSGRPQRHLDGMAVAVTDQLVPMITEVTPATSVS